MTFSASPTITPEISAITGVSEGTARVRAFRARGLLREELGAVVDTVWLEQGDDA